MMSIYTREEKNGHTYDAHANRNIWNAIECARKAWETKNQQFNTSWMCNICTLTECAKEKDMEEDKKKQIRIDGNVWILVIHRRIGGSFWSPTTKTIYDLKQQKMHKGKQAKGETLESLL